MPSEKATAIVLRTVDFSETSLIITLFTREFGKLGALAKGARRLKNPFESALDLLALCRIVFLHKSSDALDLVTEAKLLRRFRPAGRSLFGLYAGYYVAELLSELTDEDDPHPELFDLADETLEGLAAGEAVPRRIVRFELGALRLLGHMPSLEYCAECGAAVATPVASPSAKSKAACCVQSAEWARGRLWRSARACCGSWAKWPTSNAPRGAAWRSTRGASANCAAC